ncbi:right-handed parallel beta-helix repeat-containing protein [Hymenobacter setariae]|uniref:Right-handed parallel beta-helix repeat-containing protein n=1 Tax=Hymenobacter setariae TaxID=2594794 RepID=A0A558BS62_9BACT|nr:right-handed parallel beta-helix repeat-containing protein [Hymenobacter setariae]TVT39341.1 right-handed parallel beta-helix repeat-containing protein [Hymenobacter setariae]
MMSSFVYKIVFLVLLWAGFVRPTDAQTLYVDPLRGKLEAAGTASAPLASLEQAIRLAQGFSGQEPVVLRLYPGLYTLTQRAEIKTRRPAPDTVQYTVEAVVLPDDPAWQPTQMPVIQSISANNTAEGFAHCSGFLLAKDNVRFRGLKFVGNANPAVTYYYPITRESETSTGLRIAQCYFIGDRNASPIQGAVWTFGSDVRVDHTIFYGCRNALIFSKGIKDVALTNSIIYGAYEAALWFRPREGGLIFRNNIVANCAYFWIVADRVLPKMTLSNSVITGITHFTGLDKDTGLTEFKETNHVEQGIQKNGTVLLQEVQTNGLPQDYLNPLPQSAGYTLKAGIFHRK